MAYGVSYGHVTDDVTWPYDTPYAIFPISDDDVTWPWKVKLVTPNTLYFPLTDIIVFVLV